MVSVNQQTSASANIDLLETEAAEYGLVLRGGFEPSPEDEVPLLADGRPAKTLLLWGNAGSSIWPTFSKSSELQDQQTDPLNRWSERIGNLLASRWNGVALFPFGGPPYQPFIRWAKKAENLRSSQLGMLIHPQYGLWHAYRFAIALPEPLAAGLVRNMDSDHACDNCREKPCLTECPVNAFTTDGYDVKSCFDYLDTHPDAACHQYSCQARSACPEGSDYRYHPDHARFHMQKFHQSLRVSFHSSVVSEQVD